MPTESQRFRDDTKSGDFNRLQKMRFSFEVCSGVIIAILRQNSCKRLKNFYFVLSYFQTVYKHENSVELSVLENLSEFSFFF